MKTNNTSATKKTGSVDGNSNVGIKKAIALKRIINSLYFEGPLSNLDLGRHLLMTAPSVTGLLKELIKDGIVKPEGHGVSNGGRKPMMYGLVPDFGYILAVDMDQYNTRMAIFNMHNVKVIPETSFRLKLDNEKKTLDLLIDEIRSFIKLSDIDISKFLGIGLSIPGIVNTKLGINYTFLRTDKNKSLQSLLEDEFQIPVFIENDASILALAESRLGLAKGLDDVLVVKMHWGIGLGMILNGQIYRGHAGMAGEFSHIPLSDNEIMCQCGKQGCLETETSALVLAKLAQEGIRNGQLSSLQNMVNEDLEKIEADMVVKAAIMGDQYSVQILSQVGYKLGKGISILIHLFNPEMIILSGSLARANQFILVPIQQALNKYCIPRIQDTTKIAITSLEENAGLIGGLVLVVENIFKTDSN